VAPFLFHLISFSLCSGSFGFLAVHMKRSFQFGGILRWLVGSGMNYLSYDLVITGIISP
jgi:hypothetical protein